MDIVWPAFTLITEMVANVIEHGVFIASFEIWAMNLISCSRKKKRGSEIKLKAVIIRQKAYPAVVTLHFSPMYIERPMITIKSSLLWFDKKVTTPIGRF